MTAEHQRPLVVIGAGIVGLVTAFLGHRRWPTRAISVIDAGPDPRGRPGATTSTAATWSGFDARHISITETGPWTAGHRVDLMSRPVGTGGWNCIEGRGPSMAEQRWLDEFCAVAADPVRHDTHVDSVYAMNLAGIEAWRSIIDLEPETFAPTNHDLELVIVCEQGDDLEAEYAVESRLDPDAVHRLKAFPGDLSPLFADGLGGFSVRGSAFLVKTLGARLIDRLENDGVAFRWDTFCEVDSFDAIASEATDFVWAAGVSAGVSRSLLEYGVNLQGVMGCWLHMLGVPPVPPFKVLAREPVNFINCTSTSNGLLLSGGYGWVGHSTHTEAKTVAGLLLRHLESEVRRLMPGLDHYRVTESAHCLRPATPSGLPLVRVLSLAGPHRAALCVGHAAGGFTQAPLAGARALDLLDGPSGRMG